MNIFQPVNPYPHSHSKGSIEKLNEFATELSEALKEASFADFVNNNELASKTYQLIRDMNESTDLINDFVPPAHLVMEGLKDMLSKQGDFVMPYVNDNSPYEVLGGVGKGGYFPAVTVHLPAEVAGQPLDDAVNNRLQNTLRNLNQWFLQLFTLEETRGIRFYSLRIVQSYNYSPKVAYVHFDNDKESYAIFIKGNAFSGGFKPQGVAGKIITDFLEKTSYTPNLRAFALANL